MSPEMNQVYHLSPYENLIKREEKKKKDNENQHSKQEVLVS